MDNVSSETYQYYTPYYYIGYSNNLTVPPLQPLQPPDDPPPVVNPGSSQHCEEQVAINNMEKESVVSMPVKYFDRIQRAKEKYMKLKKKRRKKYKIDNNKNKTNVTTPFEPENRERETSILLKLIRERETSTYKAENMNPLLNIKQTHPIIPPPERHKYPTYTSKHDAATNTDSRKKEDKDSQTESVFIVSEEELTFLKDIKKLQSNLKKVLNLVKAENAKTKNVIIETIEIDSDKEDEMVIDEGVFGSIVQQSKQNKAVITKVLNIVKLVSANENMPKSDKENALKFFGKLITEVISRSSATHAQSQKEINTVENNTSDSNITAPQNVEQSEQNQPEAAMSENLENYTNPNNIPNTPIITPIPNLTNTSIPQKSANQKTSKEKVKLSKGGEYHCSEDVLNLLNLHRTRFEFPKKAPITNTESPLNLAPHKPSNENELTQLNGPQPHENMSKNNLHNVQFEHRTLEIANKSNQFVQHPAITPQLQTQKLRNIKKLPSAATAIHTRHTRWMDVENGKALSNRAINTAPAIQAPVQHKSNFSPPYCKNRHEQVWNAQKQLADHWSQHQQAVRREGLQGISPVGPTQLVQQPMLTVPVQSHLVPSPLAQQHLQSSQLIAQQQALERRRFLEMDLQQRAWQSQLSNYPNAAWSSTIQTDNT